MKFECEYWGVSAQGGDLDDEKEKDKLQDLNTRRALECLDQ